MPEIPYERLDAIEYALGGLDLIQSHYQKAQGPIADLGGVLAPWAANTLYGAGQCMIQAGIVYQNQTGSLFTSAATWSLDQGNWTPLTAAGVELGYSENTTDMTINETSDFGLGVSVTVNVGARPVMVEFHVPCFAATPSDAAVIDIYEDGVRQWGSAMFSSASGGNLYAPLTLRRRRTLAAGSHTWTPYARVSTGACQLLGATYAPFYLQVTQL